MSLAHLEEVAVPASSVQRQFWLLQRIQPDTRAYHVASVFRVHGHLDITALRASFDDLLARHESLRTTFEERDGVLHQCIHRQFACGFECTRELALPELCAVEEEIRRPFDLVAGPLLRVRVWIVPDSDTIVAWTMHHVITDLASKDILSRELNELYAWHSKGLPCELCAQPEQYSSLVSLEQEWEGSELARQAEDYFASHVDLSVPALSLPEDFPRPLLQSYRGACVPFELSGSLAQRLREVAAELSTKPYLVVLTAYALLLGRYSGSMRVVVGVPFTNRRREGSHTAIGCFVNTLPLTVDFSDSPTFGVLKDRVRKLMLGHHRHQEISFDSILRRVRPARDTGRNPLYQAGFTFEHPMQLALVGTESENLMLHPGGAQLDVFLTMWEDGGRFCGHLEYCSDLFAAETMQRLVGNLSALLDQVCSPKASTTAVTQFDLLQSEERTLVLDTWNQTEVDFGKPALMHELFLEQATKTPDATAVRQGNQRLTYTELAEQALALARDLQREGVTSGDRVGIYMHRSIEMVVSIFATLIVGAAYVPIDPDFPLQRIEFVIEDARPKLVLGITTLRAQWPCTSQGLRVVKIPHAAIHGDNAYPARVGPDDAAYVLFTSGSTGRPKGVAISHRAICNSMLWMQSAFRLGPADVLIQTTPYSFDVSTWELLWVFIAGAQLEIPDEGVHRDPAALAQLIEDAQVTTIHFVPSMLQLFLDQAPLGHCRSLRRVLCIGEALPSELVQRFHMQLPCELHNLYGPTEAAVQASWWYCDPASVYREVPIGRPIANTKFYILDAQQNPVPIGVPGELHIGGVQVAIEYVNRPDLTARSYLADPFAGTTNARMYRTGDLARWLPDGNVEFLGRTDFQVKVRGFRIELGEVESVLLSYPQVKQCTVVARELRPGDLRLIAYFVPNGEVPSITTLRQHLAASLPEYMIPQHFLAIDSMPTSSNGKLDRARLPLPLDLPDERTLQKEPRSPMEGCVHSVWVTHLGYGGFSLDSNFFEIGGTSLLAARIVWELERSLGRKVGLTAMFQYPTVAKLASHLAGDSNTTDGVDPRRSVADRAKEQREAIRRLRTSRST